MNPKLLLLFIVSFLSRVVAAQPDKSIGDIDFDAKTDNPQFQFCHSFVFQSYELRTMQDESRRWIRDHIKETFSYQEEWKDQSGFFVVRFAVNCLGLTDRFRLVGYTPKLKSVQTIPSLRTHLLQLVRNEKWPPGNYRLQTVDYYACVTFKIENGKLMEVIL